MGGDVNAAAMMESLLVLVEAVVFVLMSIGSADNDAADDDDDGDDDAADDVDADEFTDSLRSIFMSVFISVLSVLQMGMKK